MHLLRVLKITVALNIYRKFYECLMLVIFNRKSQGQDEILNNKKVNWICLLITLITFKLIINYFSMLVQKRKQFNKGSLEMLELMFDVLL